MNHVQILNKPISMLGDLYSLNDLHRASGGKSKHKPSNFLRLDTTKEMVKALESEYHFSDMRSAVKVINGGDDRGTYVCKELVYSYAMWVSAVFQIAVIRAFDSFVSGQIGLTQKLTRLSQQLNTVDTQLSSAGRFLCVAGKQVKPQLVQAIDHTVNQMQPSLFIEGLAA